MKKVDTKVEQATEIARPLSRQMAHELTEAEMAAISGANVWTYSDTGLSCDGPVYVQ